MSRFTIRCPKCRKQKSGATKHGFKVFALTHGVYCDAKQFNISEQKSLKDYVDDLEVDES